MKRLQFQLLLFGLVAIIAGSCSSGKYPGFKEGNNNVYYKVHERSGNPVTVTDSDWLKVNMDYRLADTVLFSSKNLNEDFIFPMIKPMFKGDLYDGVKMMAEGDSMTFAIVADSFFLVTAKMRKLPDFVEPGEPMYFDVKLLKRYTTKEYKQEVENKKAEERHKEAFKLKAYLEKNNITTKPLPSGLIFIPEEEGYGKKPDTGEMCQVYLSVSVLDGALLYSNFNKGDPIDVEYGKGFDTKGFMEGLGMLRVGGKAKLIVPSSIGVGENGMQTVPGFTTIIYEVQLEKIRSVEEVRKERAAKKKAREAELDSLKAIEPELISKYITENKIEQKPTETGLYIIPLYEGKGRKPVNGDKVEIHYSLFTLEGKKIDSSYDSDKPIDVTLGQGQVIKAWEEAILQIKEGGKARLIVPSSLAYGKGQKGEIGPYTPLIFDIEVVKIVNR